MGSSTVPDSLGSVRHVSQLCLVMFGCLPPPTAACVLPVFPLPRVTFDLLVFHKIIVLHSDMMHDVSLSQMPYSSPFSQQDVHFMLLRTAMDRSRVDGKPLYVDVVFPCYVVILRESDGNVAGQISSYHTHLMILAICSISSSRPLFVLCYGRVSRQS